MAFLAANTADERKALAAVELLVELTSNITNSPTEAKFRTIRSTTPKIAATIFALPGAPDELILALGFTRQDAEHFNFAGDSNLNLLMKGTEMLEKAVEPIKVKFMSEEQERANRDIQQQADQRLRLPKTTAERDLSRVLYSY